MAKTPAPLPQGSLSDRQRLACLRLIRSDNVGPATFRELINRFGGAEQALDALPDLARRGGHHTIRVCSREAAERELAAADRIGAQPVFTCEPGYPGLLAHIVLPPPMLYVKGHIELLSLPSVAVVGSRNASIVGLKLTRRMARDLGEAGLVVVSGLARGIDGAAHEAALATGTVAVLAGGIDVVYPPEHASLQTRIGADGCLVSEMPPGFQPRAQEFPRRNRIVSGMALGVVIMEAARRSGSLITARMSAEHGREVFAVPGHPLDPRAEGVNDLLKTGATLVTCAEDVLASLRPLIGPRDHFNFNRPGLADSLAPNGSPAPLSAYAHARLPDHMPTYGDSVSRLDTSTPNTRPSQTNLGDGERRAVLARLGTAPVSLDDIARECAMPVHVVQAVVLELAIAGRIERHGAQLISLSPDTAQ